ncbi:hypothetical protein [Duganella dendranthematis]|uniref:hypothetical protein n=1 Tax=Duganella dendranthematis TaxID=2728021 RepID=UPI001E35116B|nr:hypothetical protein [Duganella dendranthematis]
MAIDKIKRELDKFCSINLTKSAYDKVIASSIASEKITNSTRPTRQNKLLAVTKHEN